MMAVLVDPIAGAEMSLDPLYDLFRDEGIVKVFHAARQDLEIFYVEGDVIPAPLFDTQVAAMVCNFGEQVGYETLVRKIVKASVDKTSRFTDWSRRPLTDAQKNYALADVTHLRGIYEYLAKRLDATGRRGWVEEEMEILRSPETYVVDPDVAWKRIKVRTNAPKFLAIVRELAKFREAFARDRNMPRNRVYKDDALLEIASSKPKKPADLQNLRLLLREARKGRYRRRDRGRRGARRSMPARGYPQGSARPRPQPDEHSTCRSVARPVESQGRGGRRCPEADRDFGGSG